MEDRFTFTDAAAAKIRDLVSGSDDPLVGLRVGVRGGGCSGYSYFMEPAPAGSVRDEKDVVLEREGAQVIVDKRSLKVLEGAILDWVSQGLMGSRFVFDNPKARRACGCGASFAL